MLQKFNCLTLVISVVSLQVAMAQSVMFTVKLENISPVAGYTASTGAKWPFGFSPGTFVITTEKQPYSLASQSSKPAGLEMQAEDGDPSKLQQTMAAKRGIRSSGVFVIPTGKTDAGPAFSGSGFTFTVTAKPGERLGLTTMFGQSNDLFYSIGKGSIPLFDAAGKPVHGDFTAELTLYDAGTEVNQEPGIGSTQFPRQSGKNMGVSEQKAVLPVRARNDDFVYPESIQVMRLTIQPANSSALRDR